MGSEKMMGHIMLRTPRSFPGFQSLYYQEELQVSKNISKEGRAVNLSWPVSPDCRSDPSECLSQHPLVLVIPKLSDPPPWKFIMNWLSCPAHSVLCSFLESCVRIYSVPPDSACMEIATGEKRKGLQFVDSTFSTLSLPVSDMLLFHSRLQVCWTRRLE